jgi:serine/threonine protein kinase
MVCLLRVGIRGEDPAGAGQGSTLNAVGGDGRFGVYEIECLADGSLYELGRGAMGVTYRAVDTSLQRKAALKIIKIGMAGRRAEVHKLFMREARMAAALRHENIATVFQFGIREETGQCFYAMELIEGETLEERVRRTGPLNVRTTIDIAQQVTAALDAAEKRGVIHRDLKPANLMLVSPEREMAPSTATQRRGFKAALVAVAASLRRGADRKDKKVTVKIIDFGLAETLNTQADPMSLSRGGFVGTPAFASPEQFEHSALDVRPTSTRWASWGGSRSQENAIWRPQRRGNSPPSSQMHRNQTTSNARSVAHAVAAQSMLALEPAARPGTKELAVRLRHCSSQASAFDPPVSPSQRP